MIQGAFGNRTLSDLSGFFSAINALSSEKNPLRSLRVRLPNVPKIRLAIIAFVSAYSILIDWQFDTGD